MEIYICVYVSRNVFIKNRCLDIGLYDRKTSGNLVVGTEIWENKISIKIDA